MTGNQLQSVMYHTVDENPQCEYFGTSPEKKLSQGQGFHLCEKVSF